MDRISPLPDEILSKIMSFLPTKDVMRTMRLSKRWKSLWLLVPRLEFDDSKPLYWGAPEPDYENFRRFVDRSLMSREGKLLQSLYLKLERRSRDGDIEIWVGTAVKRGLMELKLEYGYSRSVIPKNLYTCETLVVLKLEKAYLDVPDLVCLRSLKTLSLESMSYSNATSLIRLLPNCPVLEDLFIRQSPYHNDPTLIFKIVVPSLKRLSLLDSSQNCGVRGLVLDAHCLKYLHIVDRSGCFSFGENITIHEVVEADFEVILSCPEKFLHSLASVVHIRLCLSASEIVYPVGSCFHRLKRLEVCTCKSEWLDLFMHLLQDSPNIKVIKINQRHLVMNPRPHWKQPSSVPKCLSTNLETLEWMRYEGTQEEKELSTYILQTAVCLKKMSITAKFSEPHKNLKILRELALSRRVSSACELVFN